MKEKMENEVVALIEKAFEKRDGEAEKKIKAERERCETREAKAKRVGVDNPTMERWHYTGTFSGEWRDAKEHVDIARATVTDLENIVAALTAIRVCETTGAIMPPDSQAVRLKTVLDGLWAAIAARKELADAERPKTPADS